MGEATVASCVVFDQNAMQTGQYRRFNIQTVSDGDDYGAMKEALTRRAARIAKEEVPHPDVWVIDGGKGGKSASPRKCSPKRACMTSCCSVPPRAWERKGAWRDCLPRPRGHRTSAR